jgi:hypothetical protein
MFSAKATKIIIRNSKCSRQENTSVPCGKFPAEIALTVFVFLAGRMDSG